jgi:hypothetical protein
LELITSDFAEWYRQYPRRIGKLKAEKAYIAIISKKKATPEELLAGAVRFAAERAGQDDKYTPYPASWLNAGRWQDEPQPKFRDPILASLAGYCGGEM